MKRAPLSLVEMLLALSLFALTPLNAVGAVYKSIGPDGNVTYSDQPQANAEKIELPPGPPPPAPVETLPLPSDVVPPTVVQVPPDAEPEVPPFTGYSTFTIITPENDETLRENNGSVAINLAIEPALYAEAGHKIALLLDGKPVLEGLTATQIQLGNVDRGTHTLQAQVSNAEGTVIASTSIITVHLKRISTVLLNDNPLLAPSLPAPRSLQAPRAPQAPTVPFVRAP